MRSAAEVSAMACPVCRVPLAMSDRQGIEIDYCPQCRGVWLDRGELDKIIERSAAEPPAPPVPPQAPPPPQAQYAPPPPPQGYQQRGYDDDRPKYDQRGHDQKGYDPRGYDPRYGGKPYKKQKHWLSEIFD